MVGKYTEGMSRRLLVGIPSGISSRSTPRSYGDT